MTSHGPKAQGKSLKHAALTGSLLWSVRGRAVRDDIERRSAPWGVTFCILVSCRGARSANSTHAHHAPQRAVIPGPPQAEPGIQ